MSAYRCDHTKGGDSWTTRAKYNRERWKNKKNVLLKVELQHPVHLKKSARKAVLVGPRGTIASTAVPVADYPSVPPPCGSRFSRPTAYVDANYLNAVELAEGWMRWFSTALDFFQHGKVANIEKEH